MEDKSIGQSAICGYDVGDSPDSCRCLLAPGHPGMHRCKHLVPQSSDSETGER